MDEVRWVVDIRNQQERWNSGLRLGCGGDPKDPSSDWPLHELVMHPVVTSLYRTHTYII
jgi:hypothetical protein